VNCLENVGFAHRMASCCTVDGLMCESWRLTGPEGKEMQVLTSDHTVINQRNLRDGKRRANGLALFTDSGNTTYMHECVRTHSTRLLILACQQSCVHLVIFYLKFHTDRIIFFCSRAPDHQ